MLAIALVGVAVNVAAGAILFRARSGSLNVEAAFRHVLADLLGSFGVIAAAIVILLTGWLEADPIVSILIGILILASSWTILRDSTGDPARGGAAGRRHARGRRAARAARRASWTCTTSTSGRSPPGSRLSRRTCSSGAGEDCHARRRELEQILAREFRIEHTTLQVDHAADPDGLVELGRF